MRKKLIVLLGLLFLSGCHLEYNLNITADKQFQEEIVITLDRADYDEDDQALRRMLESEIEKYTSLAEYENYNYDLIILRDNVYITIIRDHENFTSFAKSPFVNYVFHSIYYVEDEYYTIKTSGDIYNVNRGVAKDSKFYLQTMEINMRLQNNVANTNAHSENLTTNTFSWYYDDAKIEEAIEIDLEYTKRYDIIIMDFVMESLFYIVVFFISIILISVGAISFVINNRKRNQI